MKTKKLPTFEQTRLEWWAERDRCSLQLVDTRTTPENELLDLWDSDVTELFEDGFLDHRAFIMGKLMDERKLHHSAYLYWLSLQ